MITLHPKYIKKGYSLSALDFPATSEVCHQLEADLKEAEKEGFQYTRSFITKATNELVKGERADISVITDNTLDRDGEVILAKGLNTDQFKKNPVVAFAHKYDELPVGRCEWLKHDGDAIKAKTVYASRPDNMEGPFFPDSVWALISQDMLPAKSIGFMPLEGRAPNQKEIDERPELESAKRIITRGNLYEYSVCAVGCNPSAVAEAVAKGLDIPDHIKALLGINEPEVVAEVIEAIKSCIVWESSDYMPEGPQVLIPKVWKSLDDVEAKVATLLAKSKAKKKKGPDHEAIAKAIRRQLGRL
jgi:hypothetical protein